MSLLISSPVYDKPWMQWVESILNLQEVLINSNIEHAFLFNKGDSLVQRARNNIVTSFLESEYEKLLMIDCDIKFAPEDVSKLWNLQVPVACASYPMKRNGEKTTVWVDNELVELDKFDKPFECQFAGTGFLMIEREVFEKMRKEFPERNHVEGRHGEFRKLRSAFAWFEPRVQDGVYLSEDYAFCDDWRKMGGKIICDPSIKLTHYGSYGYE